MIIGKHLENPDIQRISESDGWFCWLCGINGKLSPAATAANGDKGEFGEEVRESPQKAKR